MQKVVTALEKNVEWIALGLAGLWVLYVVWAFVITKPVAAEIGGTQYSAASVDPAIKNDAADKLANAIGRDSGSMEIIVPEITLVWDLNPPGPLPHSSIASVPVEEFNLQEQLPPDPSNPNKPIVPGDKVAQLPTLPQPRILEVISDKGQVIPPVIQQNPNQVGPEGIAAQPLLPPQPQQQLPPDAPGAINPQFANAKDAWWVWVTGKFNEAAVQQAFDAARIPRHMARMEYLAVEVQREELLPDGKGWGNAKLIPPLKQNAPPAGMERERAPLEYLQWALQQQNQYVILEPPFFQTIGQRKIPLHLQPKVQPVADFAMNQLQSMKELAFQLESGTVLPTQERLIMGKLTPEQKAELARERGFIKEEKQRQLSQQRRQEQQQKEQQRRSTRSSGRTGSGSYAPIDPELMGEMLASGGGSGGGGFYRDPRMSGYGRGSAGAGAMPPPMINQVNPMVDPTQMNVVRPGGVLTPDQRTVFGEFDVWAYDDTVEAGKSYRYRFRVVMKNPVFKITAAVADAKLAQVMDIPSPWTEWSKPIVVDRGVDMFLAGAGRNNESVRFDIYRWQDGRVNKQAFTATPGDVVGSVDSKSKVDFNTGYAVVDIRAIANRDFRVTLIDPNGTQIVRTYQEDQGNPKRTQLDAEANKPANPALTDIR